MTDDYLCKILADYRPDGEYQLFKKLLTYYISNTSRVCPLRECYETES